MAPKKNRCAVPVITAKYITTLQRLCTLTRATIGDITDTFDELRHTLSTGVSTSPSAPPPGLRGHRGVSTYTELQGDSGDGEDFDRPCTWQPGEKQCWLVSQLEPWNRVLSRNCIELSEHTWGEMTLQGFKWPESNPPELQDVLRASLLMHLLLRQHRRVVRDPCSDAAHYYAHPNGNLLACPEEWGNGIRYLEFTGAQSDQPTAQQPIDMLTWSRSAVHLPALHSLHVTHILFDQDAANTLGNYLARTTTIKYVAFGNLQAEDKDVAVFLGYLADNKTLTNLTLDAHFVMARQGEALSHVLRSHVAIESLEITGTDEFTPSAVLRAVLQSCSLKSLTVRSFAICAEDIEAMATALMRHPPSRLSVTSAAAGPPLTHTSCLESLAFLGCAGRAPRLQLAYADLIGGTLVKLIINGCALNEAFADSAAFRLLHDKRLRVLDIKNNLLPAFPLCVLVQALHKNTTLQKMALELFGLLPQFGVDILFGIIQDIGASSRVHIDWYLPRPLDVAQSRGLLGVSSFFVDLTKYSAEDAATLLAPLVSTVKVTSVSVECSTDAEGAVVRQLADALGKTKSVREINLTLAWPESSIVSVLLSLEKNRTVSVIQIGNTTFGKRSAKALARLVEQNTMLNSISVDLLEEDVSGFQQLRTILRHLEEAMARNRFLTNLAVNLRDGNHATDSVILDALRRNKVLVNEAVRFVKGSSDKTGAFAFETLQHSRAVLLGLCLSVEQQDEERDEARAKEQINAARRRLAAKYFIFTGVIKTKLVCRPHPKGKPRLDKLGTDVLAHICSYLSLTDVMDI